MSLLSNEQHITQEVLLRYVEDDCSRTEMRVIDRHLATCPMCSDAVEGLMLLSEPSVAVAQLDKRIEEKIAEKIAEQPIAKTVELPVERPIFEVVKRPFWQQRWSAAAAVLLLASGSIWMYKNGQQAENKAVASSEIQAEPNTVLSSPMAAIAQDTINQPPQYADVQKAKKEEIIADLTKSDAIARTESAPATKKVKTSTNREVLHDSSIPNTDIVSISDKISTEKATPQAAVATAPAAYSTKMDRTRESAVVSVESSAPQVSAPMPAKVKEAKAEESENESKQAEKSIKDVGLVSKTRAKAKMPMPAAKPTPSVSTASEPILSRADNNYNKKNYQAAMADYAQFVAQETEGDDHERALFQLANCYLKLNKKAEAKVIFEKLSATNGQYQRAAKKALKDL